MIRIFAYNVLVLTVYFKVTVLKALFLVQSPPWTRSLRCNVLIHQLWIEIISLVFFFHMFDILLLGALLTCMEEKENFSYFQIFQEWHNLKLCELVNWLIFLCPGNSIFKLMLSLSFCRVLRNCSINDLIPPYLGEFLALSHL